MARLSEEHAERMVGKTVNVLWQRSPDGGIWEKFYIPVLILENRPGYLRGIVLPHKHPRGYDVSTKYPICINKYDISGWIIKYVHDGREIVVRSVYKRRRNKKKKAS